MTSMLVAVLKMKTMRSVTSNLCQKMGKKLLFLQHAEEKFNEAQVNRITFDTAKEYNNNHSQWTSVKYHLNSAVCGSEMNWRREDSRVSKDQLSTTINFKSGNIQISRSSFTDPTVSLRVTIPFRSVAGMRVNKTTDIVAGHSFSCPNVFRKIPEGQCSILMLLHRQISQSFPSSSGRISMI